LIETIYGNRLLNYGLNEKRRMRSKKSHYLDHPEFGMLVLITPCEAPEEEELATTEELVITRLEIVFTPGQRRISVCKALRL